ncbi:Ribonuclease H domain [Trinorchestia longiramus]|nr:Ribonuclease H domain [Trinorchestia longiramus]
MADDLLKAQFPAKGLSSRLLPSMNSRARALFTNVNLQIPARNAAPLVSPLPPWFKLETYIFTDFLPTSVSSQTNQNVLQMYHESIDTSYSGYTHIFTDGSCIVEPTCSASAAVVIPSRGVTINFKLRPQIHIMECELIAINEALQWILLNNCQEEKHVIFSDSLSSLHLIQNTRPKNYLPLVFNIQDKLFNIAASHWVYLQFIPHKGIPGNEAADEAAKNAHLLRYRSLTPSSYEEIKNLTNTAFKTKWKTEWLRSIQLTGKGHHLLKIRDNTGQWPWSAHKTRHIETALGRLRVGHTGLRSHLYRFSIVEDPYCSCGAEESIDHIFFSCPYYAAERTTMKNSLTLLNVPFCLKNLLGAEPLGCQLPTHSRPSASPTLPPPGINTAYHLTNADTTRHQHGLAPHPRCHHQASTRPSASPTLPPPGINTARSPILKLCYPHRYVAINAKLNLQQTCATNIGYVEVGGSIEFPSKNSKFPRHADKDRKYQRASLGAARKSYLFSRRTLSPQKSERQSP